MKVIIASCVVPFVEGGATFLVDWLGRAIRSRGHAVETLLFPFSANYTEMLDQMLALRLLDMTQHGDRLIAVRTPSHLLRHPNKILWFIHHHRPAYDLWGTRYQDIPNTPEGISYRDAIRHADNTAFSEARKIFSNSQVVADRLKQFNGVNAEVLLPPLLDPERFRCRSMGDYLLYVSRFTHHKRQWLAIEAMRHTRTPVQLVLVGKADPDSDSYVSDLRSKIEKYGLESRVSIVDRFVTEQEKIDLFSDSLAGIYFPLNEDSYGYPTLEAHHSGKPVVTTSDSGGTAELILDGVNGFLTAPDPEAIAQAMDRLYLDRSMAAQMGNAGRERITELNITWENVLEKVLGMKIAVLNNCVPFVWGGAEHLAQSLTQKLNEYGHQAMLFRIPFRWNPPGKVVESMLACRLMRLPNVDRAVAFKFPAYYIPHEDKRMWLVHQFRQAYDLWGTEFQDLPDSPEGWQIRDAIIRSDNLSLGQAQRLYTNSHVTSARLKKFNGIDSEVLYPPLFESGHFTCVEYGDSIFYPSRVTASKRQHLVVESMKYVTTPARLVIAGKEEASNDLAKIERIIRENRLEDRVRVIARFISEQEKAELFSRALGCAYIPYDEDSTAL